MPKSSLFIVAFFLTVSSAYTSSKEVSAFDFHISKSGELLQKDVQLALVHLDSAFSIAIGNNRDHQLGVCSNQRGLIHLRMGELDSAKYCYLQALDYFEDAPDSLRVRPIKNLGVLAYFRGDMKTAIAKHQEALKHYLASGNQVEIARIYSNLGVFYKNGGQFIRASKSYIQSLEYFEAIEDLVGLANSYNNIGSIYVDLERYNEAVKYFQKAIAQSENGSPEDVAIWYHNMALSMRELGELDSARYYQSISLKMRRELGDSSGIAQSYHELGLQNMAKNEYLLAKKNLQQAFNIAKRMGDVKYQAVTLNNLAEAEIKLHNPSKALRILSQLDSIDAPIQIQSEVVKHRHLSTAYHDIGADELALRHLRRYQVISDSLKNINLNRQLDEINAYYDAQQKEQTIKDQNLAIEMAKTEYQTDLQNVILLLGSITIIGVIIAARLRYQNIMKKKLLLRGQVDIARNQMSPEFLYESLDVVKRLIDHDQALAEQAVYELSNLYQKMVENFNEDLIPLEEELNLLQSYIQLMTMGRQNQLNYTCHIRNIEKYAVVPFSLLMLVENALLSQDINFPQSFKLSDNDRSFIVENLSTGKVLGAIPRSRASFPFVDQKYKLVCGRGISFEQLDYGPLIKIPKIEWQYA